MNSKIYYAAVALATIPASVFAQQTESSDEKPIILTGTTFNEIPIKRNLFLVRTYKNQQYRIYSNSR